MYRFLLLSFIPCLVHHTKADSQPIATPAIAAPIEAVDIEAPAAIEKPTATEVSPAVMPPTETTEAETSEIENSEAATSVAEIARVTTSPPVTPSPSPAPSPSQPTPPYKVAPNVDLKKETSETFTEEKPAEEPSPAPPTEVDAPALQPTLKPAPQPPSVEGNELDAEEAVAQAVPTPPQPFLILGSVVEPNTSTRLAWKPNVSFAGIATPTPVLVINGNEPGQTLCLTAAVHGDELNGIEVVRRVIYDIDPSKLKGRIVGVPIVNLQGFQRASRYLPDRRDLNRYFPGSADGSLASRIAYSLVTEIIQHCDALIDLHTASFHRTNLPQVRADLRDEKVAEFTKGFDKMVIIQSEGGDGTLRRETVRMGIPAVTLEIGQPLILEEEQVSAGVKSVLTLLDSMGLYEKFFTWGSSEPAYYQSSWVRAPQGGILFSTVAIGDRVTTGTLLGTITDPITNKTTEIRAKEAGRVIGMALNQVVLPGFAVYHMGRESSNKEELIQESETNAPYHGDESKPDLKPE